MAIKDKEIFQIYSALEKICIEINDLFSAIDELMGKNKFVPFSNNRLRLDAVETLGSPRFWLPFYSQRIYKREKDSNYMLGINLLMKDLYGICENIIPFFTCGLIRYSGTMDEASNLLYNAGLIDNDENKLMQLSNSFFSITKSKSENVEILSYFIKLTAVDTIANAKKLIVDPLNIIYNSLPADWKNTNELENVLEPIAVKIKNDMLILEQIRGDAPLE